MVKPAKKCCKYCQDYKYCKKRSKCCQYCDHYSKGKCYYAEHTRQSGKTTPKDLVFSNYRGDEYGMDDYEEYEEQE
ncbi:MAG: hypothetical protein FJY77_00415 [Candidatus Altiarchaeales archaeon]|nr:hypothetical protein [Candidatus Altiarchaeales archaeon]